jgi:hypothetical protein
MVHDDVSRGFFSMGMGIHADGGYIWAWKVDGDRHMVA